MMNSFLNISLLKARGWRYVPISRGPCNASNVLGMAMPLRDVFWITIFVPSALFTNMANVADQNFVRTVKAVIMPRTGIVPPIRENRKRF